MRDIDELFLSPQKVTEALTSVTFNGITVWETKDTVHISFPSCPIEYTWDTKKYILDLSYYGLEGIISYSLFFDAWENNRALDLFYELVEGADECLRERRPYIVYGFVGDDPHCWSQTSIYKRPLEEYDNTYRPTFKVTIFPRKEV